MPATAAPDPPLQVPVRGLARVDHLRALLSDLGPRVNIRGTHLTQPAGAPVPGADATNTLRYFQFDKTTGVAKTPELRRLHALLLKAVPSAARTPFKARKYTGTLNCSDIHAFRKHWLAIFKAQTENPA
jgi:hypothetical protein